MNREYFLNSKTSLQWKKLGIKKRAGVVIPLFSIWSKNSAGIGEYTDLKLIVDWCSVNGLSIIQLLPLNETGNDFSPYNAIGSFALEPAYLNLNELKGVQYSRDIRNRIENLIKLYGRKKNRVDYKIKAAKLKLLSALFGNANTYHKDFHNFLNENSYWLDDFALYKKLSSLNKNSHWFKWNRNYRNRNTDSLKKISDEYLNDLFFIKWVQWQSFEQLKSVKRYCNDQKVILIGDLPYLVSPDSADVWVAPENFVMDKVAGAPPDMYMPEGQRWGMHPYNWYNIAAKGFEYFKKRMKYSENFYHAYRIDHFIGLFRIWTIDKAHDEKSGSINGNYEPRDERIWEMHGREILDEIVNASGMLPVAEDLGTVPACSYKVLHEFGIPGMEVMRWKKNYDGTFEEPGNYRVNSVSVLSTHDSSTLPVWWKYEASKVDLNVFENELKQRGLSIEKADVLKTKLFRKKINTAGKLRWRKRVDENFIETLCENYGSGVKDYLLNLFRYNFPEKKYYSDLIGYTHGDPDETGSDFVEKSILKILSASSIFSIQLIMEWLYLDDKIIAAKSSWRDRINIPGTVSKKNWSWKSPLSIEQIISSKINNKIKSIVKQSGR